MGAYLAFYSGADDQGKSRRACAQPRGVRACVDASPSPAYGPLRALLGQKGYRFAGLSRRAKRRAARTCVSACEVLDTGHCPRREPAATRASAGAPFDWSPIPSGSPVASTVATWRSTATTLVPAAARHVVVVKGGGDMFTVMFRKDRRKKPPAVRVNFVRREPEVFLPYDCQIRLPTSANSPRDSCDTGGTAGVVGDRPKPSIMLKSPRPKMYRSVDLRPDQIDYLYSELTCVAW